MTVAENPVNEGPGTVCLCMMLRNESRIIERALDSVAGEIDGWCITDTGSTDGTQEIVRKYFTQRGIPGRLHETQFVDFGASRTETINNARAWCLEHGIAYLLLLDGDELIEVKDPGWKSKLSGAPYLIEYAGPLSYRVVYLIPTSVEWRFVGRTHEYIEAIGSAPPPEFFDGIQIHDRADGGSKGDKFSRDIRLLKLTLDEDEKNERAWFYLGESYFNSGLDYSAALDAYTKRTTLGGFEEEAWFAAYRRGSCIEELAGESGDPWPALVAYMRAFERRQWRAEPIASAVRLCAERRLYLLGTILGEYALQHVLPRRERAKDILFVSRAMHGAELHDWLSICAWNAGYPVRAIALAKEAIAGGGGEGSEGRIRRNLERYAECVPEVIPAAAEALVAATRFREEGLNASCMIVVDALSQLDPQTEHIPLHSLALERSIAGLFVGRKAEAAGAAWELVTRRDTPADLRLRARENLWHHVELLPRDVFTCMPVRLQSGSIPDGYAATNPCIAEIDGVLVIVVRAVNYRIRADGAMEHPGFVDTRNFLGRISADGIVSDLREIAIPASMQRNEGRIRGFEDCRIFALKRNDSSVFLVGNSVHPRFPDHRAMFLMPLVGALEGEPAVTDAVHLRGVGDSAHQKNWMPVMSEREPVFVYSCDPTVVVNASPATGDCRARAASIPPWSCSEMRGGSQLVPIPRELGGGFIALTHAVLGAKPRRSYRHNLVLFDDALSIRGISHPFVFRSRDIEFAAGCAIVGDALLMSWGEGDATAWVGSMPVTTAIRLCLGDAAWNPTASLPR